MAQQGYAPRGIRSNDPSTCPCHGTHQTKGALTHSCKINMYNCALKFYYVYIGRPVWPSVRQSRKILPGGPSTRSGRTRAIATLPDDSCK